MELRTARLLLRECRPVDHAAIHTFASDAEVTRYTVWGPNTADDTARLLAEAVADTSKVPRGRYLLAITPMHTDIAIGWIRLEVVNQAHGRAELGYAISPVHAGKGYTTEAAAAMLDFAFGMDFAMGSGAAFSLGLGRGLGLRKVVATCDPLNRASARVLERIGMRREGYLHDHVLVRGQWRDRLLYGAVSTMLRPRKPPTVPLCRVPESDLV